MKEVEIRFIIPPLHPLAKIKIVGGDESRRERSIEWERGIVGSVVKSRAMEVKRRRGFALCQLQISFSYVLRKLTQIANEVTLVFELINKLTRIRNADAHKVTLVFQIMNGTPFNGVGDRRHDAFDGLMVFNL